MTHKIAVIGGDGIGPEVLAQAHRVLDAAAGLHGLQLSYDEAKLGGAAIDACGVPLPAATLDAAAQADALAALGRVGLRVPAGPWFGQHYALAVALRQLTGGEAGRLRLGGRQREGAEQGERQEGAVHGRGR